jgi:septal ring factor EnvC (AmiA/AmiB activator)
VCTKSDCPWHYLSSSEDESWQGDFEDDASSWASASEYNIDPAEAAQDSRAYLGSEIAQLSDEFDKVRAEGTRLAQERDALEQSIAAAEEAMKVEAIFSLAFHQHQMRASEDEDEGEQVVVSSKGLCLAISYPQAIFILS